MDQRHGVYPVDGDGKLFGEFLVREVLFLDIEEGNDGVKVVFDPVVDLVQEDLFLLQVALQLGPDLVLLSNSRFSKKIDQRPGADHEKPSLDGLIILVIYEGRKKDP